jgi:hypothetical protein
MGCIFLGSGAGAQTFTMKPVKLLPVTKPAYKLPVRSVVSPSLQAYPVTRVAPDAYYNQCFGFFCKKEWDWQKHTGIPVKVRLGNYSYAQKQEGKH